jgi:predicted amidohydrolase YtcJ
MTATLYRGGRIYSPASPRATAFVAEDGRIAWLGSDDAADNLGVTEVTDLGGALVTPAFVDAHVHTTATGLALTGLDLSSAATLTDALDMVARYAASRPGATVLGHGWEETRWPEGRPPTAGELNRAAGGAQVYLSRADVHSAAVSSALLAAVPGLEAMTGYSAAGHLTVDAHHAVRALAYATITAAQRADAQRATRSAAAALGIGSFHECGGPGISGEDDFTGLLALAAAEPGPEVYGYWGELMAAGKARELGAVGAGGDLFADGALGSSTAALTSDYADKKTRGHVYLDGQEAGRHIADCVRHGMQPGFHAIGDHALELVLNEGFGAAAAEVGVDRIRLARPRIEHAEMVDSRLVKQLVEYGVIASVQPAFDAAWGGGHGLYAQRLGRDRALTLNPFATMAGVGVPLAFGSDSPVTPLGPWAAIRAAANHQTPGQSISMRAAFAAHTRGGWRAAGRDDEGVLAPGAPATFAIWSAGDVVVTAPDERISRWSTDPRSAVPGLPSLDGDLPTCLRTVVRGRTIHLAAADHPAAVPEGGP